MARKGGKKKTCEKYKLSGHREENKRKRQARAKKREEMFAARKEAGKSYEYNKQRSAAKIAEVYDVNSDFYKSNKEVLNRKLFAPNQGSNQARHTELSRWKSVERKLNNEVSKRKNEMKKNEGNTRTKRQ